MNLLRPAERHLKGLGIQKPSQIDIEAIAYDAGAIIKYRQLAGCEARILGVGDKAVITVDKRAIPSRRRFSAAHELGHWHHHRGRSFICRKDDIGNPKLLPTHPERVADEYAADLLMPQYLFGPIANELKKCSFKSVDALREEFQTSVTATAIRLVDLGPEPAMLICHTHKGRAWFRRPECIPTRWFPQDELDADSYAFDVLNGRDKESRRVLIGADAWFDRWFASKYQIYEESRQISDGEILTLIVFKDEAMLDDEE